MQGRYIWKRVKGLLAIVLSIAMVVETPQYVAKASVKDGSGNVTGYVADGDADHEADLKVYADSEGNITLYNYGTLPVNACFFESRSSMDSYINSFGSDPKTVQIAKGASATLSGLNYQTNSGGGFVRYDPNKQNPLELDGETYKYIYYYRVPKITVATSGNGADHFTVSADGVTYVAPDTYVVQDGDFLYGKLDFGSGYKVTEWSVGLGAADNVTGTFEFVDDSHLSFQYTTPSLFPEVTESNPLTFIPTVQWSVQYPNESGVMTDHWYNFESQITIGVNELPAVDTTKFTGYTDCNYGTTTMRTGGSTSFSSATLYKQPISIQRNYHVEVYESAAAATLAENYVEGEVISIDCTDKNYDRFFINGKDATDKFTIEGNTAKYTVAASDYVYREGGTSGIIIQPVKAGGRVIAANEATSLNTGIITETGNIAAYNLSDNQVILSFDYSNKSDNSVYSTKQYTINSYSTGNSAWFDSALSVPAKSNLYDQGYTANSVWVYNGTTTAETGVKIIHYLLTEPSKLNLTDATFVSSEGLTNDAASADLYILPGTTVRVKKGDGASTTSTPYAITASNLTVMDSVSMNLVQGTTDEYEFTMPSDAIKVMFCASYELSDLVANANKVSFASNTRLILHDSAAKELEIYDGTTTTMAARAYYYYQVPDYGTGTWTVHKKEDGKGTYQRESDGKWFLDFEYNVHSLTMNAAYGSVNGSEGVQTYYYPQNTAITVNVVSSQQSSSHASWKMAGKTDAEFATILGVDSVVRLSKNSLSFTMPSQDIAFTSVTGESYAVTIINGKDKDNNAISGASYPVGSYIEFYPTFEEPNTVVTASVNGLTCVVNGENSPIQRITNSASSDGYYYYLRSGASELSGGESGKVQIILYAQNNFQVDTKEYCLNKTVTSDDSYIAASSKAAAGKLVFHYTDNGEAKTTEKEVAAGTFEVVETPALSAGSSFQCTYVDEETNSVEFWTNRTVSFANGMKSQSGVTTSVDAYNKGSVIVVAPSGVEGRVAVLDADGADITDDVNLISSGSNIYKFTMVDEPVTVSYVKSYSISFTGVTKAVYNEQTQSYVQGSAFTESDICEVGAAVDNRSSQAS